MTETKSKPWLAAIARGWKVWVGLLGLAAIIVWVGGVLREKVPPGRVEVLPGRPLPADAVLLVVSNESVAARIDVVGTVTSEERIQLSARIPATIKEVFASAGDAVNAGQPLIALDDREINEQLAAAEAQLKQAETEFNRARRLLETQATTEQAFGAAESMFRSAKANVDRVKVMQTYTRIASPIDGIVTDRRVEVGDLANPGQVLLAVYDPARMRIEAPVPVRLLTKLSKGQEVEVALDRIEGVVKGRVTAIVGEVDAMSRTQKVKIRLEGVSGLVLPGTFGRVWVHEDPHDCVMLPRAAVCRMGQLEYVQIARDGRRLQRLVRTGPVQGDRVEIVSGLGAGEVVIANPVVEE